MSCFWDTLISKINKNDIHNVLKIDNINPTNFAKELIKINKLVNTILVNNNEITNNQQKENYEHIKNYDIGTIKNGYDCSTFDPFLILISDLFSITINNNYDNCLIIYKPIAHSRYNIKINNNKGHMS
jgi:hypothetical protein